MRFGMNGTGYPPDIDFGTLVTDWYALQANLSSVCDSIFSLRSGTASYLEQQTFTIASAIEALHRALNPQLEEKSEVDRARTSEILAAVKSQCPQHRGWLANLLQYAHRPTYISRVRELLEETDHLMASIVGDEKAWTQRLRSVRDGIGHILPSTDTRVFDQLVAIRYSAQLFAEVVLLCQLGFTNDECRQAIERNSERAHVQALVKKGFPDWFKTTEEP
jgi:hypothetical protein